MKCHDLRDTAKAKKRKVEILSQPSSNTGVEVYTLISSFFSRQHPK